MNAALKTLALALAVLAFPAAAASRPSDARPNSAYELAADAFLRPAATELRVRVSSETEPAPAELEKLQVKIWPLGSGDVETRNMFDLVAPNGVATVELPRLRLTQRVEVRAHVKSGSQNTLEAETTVQYEQWGAVSTDERLATQTGADVLRAGGNAFDAAAAILFVLNVTQPHLAGIGGGANIVAHVTADRRTYSIDARERAPAATTPQMYNGPQTVETNSLQGYTVGVPGALRAVDRMLREWGTMSLAETLQPAIRIAEAQEGVSVGVFLARGIAEARTPRFPQATRDVLMPGGNRLGVGSRLSQRDLANTFRLIAEHGTAVFYEGEIAAAIVEAQKYQTIPAGEGRMTREDLASYDVGLREASHLDYRGYGVHSSPPGGSTGGMVLLETLGLLEDERFPMGDVARDYGFGTKHTIHAMVEAVRLALADRDALMTAPGFFPTPWPAVPEAPVLSDSYLRERSARMNPFPVRMPAVEAGTPYEDTPTELDGHTTHFSVIDRHGNVVSFTATLADSFGTGIIVPGYGFFLNDSLRLFNINAAQRGGANDAGPGKRPMGSMTPVVITRDGEPFAVTGTYGSTFIPTLVLNVVLDLIDHRMPLQTAVDASRIWLTVSGGTFAWNYAARPGAPSINQSCTGTPPNLVCSGVMEELRAIGHAANRRSLGADPTFGSLASVGVDPATFALQGAADPRQADASALVVTR